MSWRRCYSNRKAGFKARRGRGQAVVEFALVMVLFLVILLAVIDLGRAWFTSVGLENAAAEGALYGMANPNCVNQGDCGSPEHSIDFRIRNESQNALMDPSQVAFSVEFEDPVNKGPGTYIKVTVLYPFRPILPLLSTFGASTITMHATAIQLIP